MHLQDAPSVYKDCSYSIWEISQPLSQTQTTRLDAAGHSGRFEVSTLDATARHRHSRALAGHRFVLGMEILDNCAHDKSCPSSPWASDVLTSDLVAKEVH